MSTPQPAATPQPLAAHVTSPTVPDLRHIWMASQRSLCDLAVRRVVGSSTEAHAGNVASRELPPCEACVVVVDMLTESKRALTDGGRQATYPSREDALELLSTTTWPWVASTLVRP